MWHICAHKYNGILLNHKKNEIMSFEATWMDVEMIILSQIKKYMLSLTCGI